MSGGTGLGLYSLSKRIDALGGTYGIDQRPDGQRGSSIWFTFPYRPDATFESLHRNSIVDSKLQAGHKVGGSFRSVPSGVAGKPSSTAALLSSRGSSGSGCNSQSTSQATSGVATPMESPSSQNLFDQSAYGSGFFDHSAHSDTTDERRARARSMSQSGNSIYTQSESCTTSLRVLLVDDSMAILKVTSRALTQAGHQVKNGRLYLLNK